MGVFVGALRGTAPTLAKEARSGPFPLPPAWGGLGSTK
jgi:hypothetical protein